MEESTPAASAQSPSISRFITERPRILNRKMLGQVLFVGIISGVLLVGVILQSLHLVTNYQKEALLGQERQQLTWEVDHWKQVQSKYPEYRDVSYRIAVLEYKLGNEEESQKHLKKALELDPNFEKGRVLGEKIGF